MTVRSGTLAQGAGLLAIVLTLFFLAGIAGLTVLGIATIVIGVAAPFLAYVCDIHPRRWWTLPLSLAVVSLFALGMLAVTRPIGAILCGLPLILFAIVWGTSVVSEMTKRRCSLCHRRLGPRAITFDCPRCGLEVCDESCWNFEHRRCRMCEENRVPILPAQSQWWDRHLGPRVQNGRCQLCMASSEQADLRTCGHCRRPQCRDCWDQANGECTRCGWTMPDLPKSLEAVAVHLPAHLEP
jgi:hypothetical protein